MIHRIVTNILNRRLQDSPAVVLVGPRQCGKTTLAKSLGGDYYDLEQPSERLRLDLEWSARTSGQSLVILDEAQSWPEVFARLRGAIDLDRSRNGRFLLLGSVSPALMTQVSESLAGRLAIVELSPFTWEELPEGEQRERLWWCGGYPAGGATEPRHYPQWQLDYLALLSQRDLPAWGMPAKPQQTDRLLRMLAAVHGQLWNASRIGQSLGVSYHTVNAYLDYLEGAFLIRRLPPFYENLGKRLTKSPRLYWRDSGLLHALLNVTDPAALYHQPWVGASWEGFVIEQILGALTERAIVFRPYFFRANGDFEIDLIVDRGTERWAIEIKLTSSPDNRDMERLNRAADLIGASRRILVSQVAVAAESDRGVSCNLPWLLARLAEWCR